MLKKKTMISGPRSSATLGSPARAGRPRAAAAAAALSWRGSAGFFGAAAALRAPAGHQAGAGRGGAAGDCRRAKPCCEMGGEYKESYADVRKVLMNYLNYKVRREARNGEQPTSLRAGLLFPRSNRRPPLPVPSKCTTNSHKAVRLVLSQLQENDMGRYTWLYQFTTANKPNDAEEYCKALMREERELGERVMVTRVREK